MKILVTGGAGFIGSNFIRYLLTRYPTDEIINFDALTYAGNLDNLTDLCEQPRYRFVRGDITDRDAVEKAVREGVCAIVNFAAESHVDRSIIDSTAFVRTNVLGTQVLLDAAKRFRLDKYVQVSTDEVYGALGADGFFTETTPLAPNSPYSASKAAADLLVRSYHETYGLPVSITRCSNNYGPYQFPEKLIPLTIANAMANKPIPVYGDGMQVRDWLHVQDHCAAIDLVLRYGEKGGIYNIGGHNERTNLQIVRTILQELRRGPELITHVADRLGHDRRYAIDAAKISDELGWEPRYNFESGIRETVRWYQENEAWWRTILNRAAVG